MGAFTAKTCQNGLGFLKEMLEEGKVVYVIDNQVPLSEIADAMRYLGTGHARAKVVIALRDE